MTFARGFLMFVWLGCSAVGWTAQAKSLDHSECLNDKAIRAPQLYGRWQVMIENPPAGLPKAATMTLTRHAEFSESLAGTVVRTLATNSGPRSNKAALAGDLEDTILILDESSNNINITGTWNAEMVAGSCGRLFKGVWKDTSSSAPLVAPDVPFTLRKLP